MKSSFTASERIVDALTEQITSRVLEPGARLSEAAIAREFETSRTPARDALRALVQAGLVERTDTRHYVVSQVDLRSVRQIYRIRAALEDLVVCELHENLGPDDFANLLQDIGSAEGHENPVVCRFHETLAEKCGNAELYRTLNDIYTRLEPYRIFDGKCRAEAVDADHRELLAALRDGDLDRARRLMSEHIGRSVTAINELLDRGIVSANFVQPHPKRGAARSATENHGNE